MSRIKGRVKWFNKQKGFGFIEVDRGNDVFVHISQVPEVLKDGDEVEFAIKDSKRGLVAVEVEVLNADGTKRSKRPA